LERPINPGAWQVGGASGGWWSRERARFLAERLDRRLRAASVSADVGCGDGSFTEQMATTAGGLTVGCDFERSPVWTNVPGRLAFVACDARTLPFRSACFDVVVALDVIEHFPDDQAPLSELRRTSRPGGAVGLAVPAMPRLWSRFDESVGHYRRYRAAGLEAACRRSGLRPKDATYFFAWLVGPAWLLRRRDRRDADRISTGAVGRLIDGAVSTVSRMERAWLRRRRLSFGTSLWCIAVRPVDDEEGPPVLRAGRRSAAAHPEPAASQA
jgi:SAM-dependent methyltransferase